MASARRRTGNSSGSGDRSINCWARSAVCRSPWLCGIRMARDSMATVSASSARVAAGMSAIAARLPAVASRSTVSSASNNHRARSSPLTPGHSAPGLTRSSIWAWTINAVSLSRPVRIRSRRRAPLVELAGPHDVGGGVDDDRHPRPQRPNVLPQNTFRPIGHQEGAPDEAAQAAHQGGADQPRQLGELRPQIQREEVRHEGDHPQRGSAWAEPAHIDRDEHHQHEPDVGDHRVRREQRGRGDGQRGGQRQQRHRDSLPTRIGLVHRARRDHRDQHPEQRDRQRLPGGLGQQEQGQQSGRQRAGGPGGHPQPQQPGIRSDRPVTRPLVQRGCVTEHPWPASLLRNACLLHSTLAQRPRWDPMSTRTTLADGRELLFFSLPGHTPAPVVDRRPLPPWEPGQSQLRFDQTTGQWVIIAARRQDRTYKPPPDQCPLCPGPTGLTSEVPAPDYDVVVFENRFPSLSGAGAWHRCRTASCRCPVSGRCEVICFSSNHTGSFGELSQPHARLVVDAWRHRTADSAGDARRGAGVLLREPGRGDRRHAGPSARPDLRLLLCDTADGGDDGAGA